MAVSVNLFPKSGEKGYLYPNKPSEYTSKTCVKKLNVDKAVCLILGICVPASLSFLRNWLKSIIGQNQGQKTRLGCGRGVAELDLFLHFAP